MDTMRRLRWLGMLLVLLLGAQALVVARAEEHHGHPGGRVVDGRGHVLDNRYNHGHYYPAVGASVRTLPEGYRPYFHGGHPYYFYGGVWYAPGPIGFVVVHPPIGVVVSVLPPYYTTVWFAGVPYYYADDAYYIWDPAQNGYVVAGPPANADSPAAPPAPPPGDLIIYPKNGQSNEQQAADKYDCHNWARSQTGFDPTQPGGGVPPPNGASAQSNYDRAMSACLTARGYEVK